MDAYSTRTAKPEDKRQKSFNNSSYHTQQKKKQDLQTFDIVEIPDGSQLEEMLLLASYLQVHCKRRAAEGCSAVRSPFSSWPATAEPLSFEEPL